MIQRSAFSGETFPRKSSDSTIEITNQQAIEWNQLYIYLDECQTDYKIDKKSSLIKDTIIADLKTTVKLYQAKDSLYVRSLGSLGTIIDIQTKEQTALKETFTDYMKNQKKKNIKIYSSVGGAVAAFIIVKAVLAHFHLSVF